MSLLDSHCIFVIQSDDYTSKQNRRISFHFWPCEMRSQQPSHKAHGLQDMFQWVWKDTALFSAALLWTTPTFKEPQDSRWGRADKGRKKGPYTVSELEAQGNTKNPGQPRSTSLIASFFILFLLYSIEWSCHLPQILQQREYMIQDVRYLIIFLLDSVIQRYFCSQLQRQLELPRSHWWLPSKGKFCLWAPIDKTVDQAQWDKWSFKSPFSKQFWNVLHGQEFYALKILCCSSSDV